MNRLETTNSRSANRAKFAFAALMALSFLFAQSLVTTALADKRPKDYGRVKIFVPIHDPVKNPDGYQLLVDGEDYGNTTANQRTLQLASGRVHTIEVVFPDNKRWTRDVFINAGRIYCIGVEYSPFKPPDDIVPCPPCSVTLETTAERVDQGDQVEVTAHIAYTGAKDNVAYTWTVSPGNARVLSGGGPTDSKIILDTTDIGVDKLEVNLAVDTGTFSSDQKKCNCENAMTSVIVEFNRPDVFQFVAFDDLKARLDNLAIDLQRYKDANAYIYYYTGEQCGDALESRLGERAREYLVNERGFDGNRLVIRNGGRSAIDWMEIYVVPLGKEAPPPNPAKAPAARADLKNRCMQDVTTAEQQQRQQQQRRPSRRRR